MKNLNDEGITKNVFLAGNTIVDAVRQNLEIANKKVDILKKLGLKKGDRIIYGGYSHEEIELANDKFIILELKDVLARVE